MPDTSDYKTQVSFLIEMVMDLYAKNAALAGIVLGSVSNREDLQEAEREAWKAIGLLPETAPLLDAVDNENLGALSRALRGFR